MTFEQHNANWERNKQRRLQSQLAKIPDAARAVALVDHRRPEHTMIVHRSTQAPGKWQLSWFHSGEPWGHTDMDTLLDCVRSAMGIYGKPYGPPHGNRDYRVREAA